MAEFILGFIVLAVLVIVLVLPAMASFTSGGPGSQFDDGIQTAVEIAKHQGWVSRYRLVKQHHLKGIVTVTGQRRKASRDVPGFNADVRDWLD